MKVRLDQYNNDWYDPGAGPGKRTAWYFVNVLFFKNGWNPLSGLKVRLLRLFGARVGRGVIIKPAVNIKYPWKLTVGDHVWIGEQVWIDNLDRVTIGDHVCLSQGAMLLCGNHDYKKPTFDLITGPIILEEGVWVGAKAIVCPGIVCRAYSVLTAGSIATETLEASCIYQGNPAILKKRRRFSE